MRTQAKCIGCGAELRVYSKFPSNTSVHKFVKGMRALPEETVLRIRVAAIAEMVKEEHRKVPEVDVFLERIGVPGTVESFLAFLAEQGLCIFDYSQDWPSKAVKGMPRTLRNGRVVQPRGSFVFLKVYGGSIAAHEATAVAKLKKGIQKYYAC